MGRVDTEDVEWTECEKGETHFNRKKLSEAADGERIGCSLYEIPPGRRSWPYHYHTKNEEAIFVLDGTGTLRLGEKQLSISEGEYIALPANEEGAHRVINDSDNPLRYLMVSTMDEPDVTVYPDSGKFGVYAGSPPGSTEKRTIEGYYQQADAVDYWRGEEPTVEE